MKSGIILPLYLINKIALLEYLNTQTVFLYFEPAMFIKDKFVRNDNDQIIESSYEGRLVLANDLLGNHQLDLKQKDLQRITLKTLVSFEDKSVKSTLLINGNSKTQIIEVT